MPVVCAPDLNVISVINPGHGENAYDVEIRPQELLQVILVDKGSDVEWRYIETQAQIGFKVLRTETLYTDGVERMTEGNFQVLPYTKKQGKLQHHFWFRINPDDAKEVMDLEERWFELATIGFYEVETGKEVGKVKVNMIMEQADKNDFIDLMTETVFTGRDLVKQEAQTLGLSNSYVSEKDGYILNPGPEERVNLECRQRIAIIELAQPPRIRATKKWKLSGECAAWAKSDNFLSVVEIAPRFINAARVQRFLVRNELHNLPDGIDKIRLGEVSFGLNDEGCAGGSWRKKVIFSAVREREKNRKSDFITQHYGDYENDEDIYDLDARRHDVDSWLTCVVRNRHCNTEDFIVRKPRKVPVKIEEIDGTLTSGVNLIKVFLPPVEHRHYVCDHPKKRQLSGLGDIVEIADPPGNTMVELNQDQKLIVMLYNDISGRKDGKWELVNISGGVLESRGTTDDERRIQFWFEQNDKQSHEVSIIVFRRGGERRLLHVFLTGRKVQKIKTEKVGVVSFEEENKILQELLMRESDYRTVTSLRVETEISEEKLQDALEKLEKDDRVIRHPEQVGLWGHKNRIAFGQKGAIELQESLEQYRCL